MPLENTVELHREKANSFLRIEKIDRNILQNAKIYSIFSHFQKNPNHNLQGKQNVGSIYFAHYDWDTPRLGAGTPCRLSSRVCQGRVGSLTIFNFNRFSYRV